MYVHQQTLTRFRIVIVAIFVDDLNFVGTVDVISHIVFNSDEFEMIDFGETTLFLDLQIECLAISTCLLNSS